jgi:methyl-accepting chemotaxis protein
MTAARDIAKRIASITRANIDHSNTSTEFIATLNDIRQVSERNAAGVQETLRATGGLVNRAQTLNAIMDRAANNEFNGKKSKNKKKSKR